jgi:hypothetical protein
LIEVLVRLGLALLLSLSLAVLLAWGWHSSDRSPVAPEAIYSAATTSTAVPALPAN